MTSSGAIHVSAGYGRSAILHDTLRLRFTAHAAIGSRDELGCSKELAQ
jgi:hypothetical protein